VRAWSPGDQKLFHVQADVACDLPEQSGRDVASRVKRDRLSTSIGMTVLLVRAALPNFLKAERQKESGDLAGLEDRDRPDVYATRTV
jgi:hypothetical protein